MSKTPDDLEAVRILVDTLQPFVTCPRIIYQLQLEGSLHPLSCIAEAEP